MYLQKIGDHIDKSLRLTFGVTLYVAICCHKNLKPLCLAFTYHFHVRQTIVVYVD